MPKEGKDTNLTHMLKGAVEMTKDVVKDIDLSDAKEKVQKATDSVVEAVKKVKLPDIDVKNIFKKKEKDGENSIENGKNEKKVKTEEKGIKEADVLNITAIPTRNAIKIFYYLMAADGEIFHSEEEKFDSIGKELDPEFSEHKEQIIKECQGQLDKVIDPDDYYDTVQDGIEDQLIHMKVTDGSFITSKLLVWDILTVAYSDERYNEVERKLLKYVVRKTNIDKAMFLEMESSILTLMDIENELEWIKTTNRPYLAIESMVNELNDRKNVIFESVKDLIAL